MGMVKKYIALFIAAVFLLGTASLGLCSVVTSHSSPKCCSDNQSPPASDADDCFSHCLSRPKASLIKIENYSEEDLKLKSYFFDAHSSSNPELLPDSVY